RGPQNATLWNISPRSSGSLGLDVGGPDHLSPFFSFLLKPPPVIRGRAAGDAAAHVGTPHLPLGVRQRGVNRLVEFVTDVRGRDVFDDGRGRVLGCADD